MSSKPEKVFKVGAARASVFFNAIQHNGRAAMLPKVVIEVRYRDKTGQWKGTNSLSLNDLPKAVLALQSAYAYLLDKRAENPEEGAESPSDSSPLFSPNPPSEKKGLFPNR